MIPAAFCPACCGAWACGEKADFAYWRALRKELPFGALHYGTSAESGTVKVPNPAAIVARAIPGKV
jgi:hypothetical protein